MKLKNTLTLITTIFFLSALSHAASTSSDKLIVKVKGMVCSFCTQGITKNFNKQKQVKDTKVNLDNMEVTLHFEAGQKLPKKTIKQIVKDSGFSFEGVK